MYFQREKKKQTNTKNGIREDKKQFSSFAANFLLINKAKMISLNQGICQWILFKCSPDGGHVKGNLKNNTDAFFFHSRGREIVSQARLRGSLIICCFRWREPMSWIGLNTILSQSSREGIIKDKMGLGGIFANPVKIHLALLVVRQELTKLLILHNFRGPGVSTNCSRTAEPTNGWFNTINST